MPSLKDRRTRARVEMNVSQEASRTPIIIDSKLDDSPLQAPIKDKCSNKTITTGKKVDFDCQQNEGFDIGNKIKRISWSFLCSLDVSTYTGLVREFYNTLGQVGNRFKCTVKGKHLHITEDVLARIL